MPRQRPQKGALERNIPLHQPDRSGPSISQETLFDIAEKHALFREANGAPIQSNNGFRNESNDPPVGRLGEAVLWGISLAMLHFTFDVLVQHQYAVEISWQKIFITSVQAFGVFLVLCYTLHPHSRPSPLFLHFPLRYQAVLSQLLFFTGSVASGCYLIYITNEHNYHAIMKRAPPVGCMWVWSVIELDLKWALANLMFCGMFLWWGGYSYG